MIDELERLVGGAVTEVFGTMLNFQVSSEPPGCVKNGETHVAGSVGFVGTLNGIVYVYSGASFARRLTGSLLGLKENEIIGEEMVDDAIGELTNMIVGHVKSRLSDKGHRCNLTIPSTIRGEHLSVGRVSATERRVLFYSCDGSQLVVELIMKPVKSAV
ncbi:MAG: chemotaxis protein CheX [Verrucomicrobiota bacterium]|nr:chemotaxis protein CheX [Verrucomicrobiota bacterium]